MLPILTSSNVGNPVCPFYTAEQVPMFENIYVLGINVSIITAGNAVIHTFSNLILLNYFGLLCLC